MSPLVKKAVAALAIKEGLERIAEARRPKKPSLLARLGKLTLLGGLATGLYYAYKGGALKGITDKLSGKSAYDSYEGSVTVSRPAEAGETSFQSETEPVGSPTT